MEQGLERFTITDSVIAMMKDEYLPLKINGISDKEGYSKVKEARLTVKSKRVEVEKVRKELKEDSLRYGRLVDAEAKRITSLLEPIESYLSEEQSRIDTEKENIRLEKERKEKELLQNRLNEFQKYDFVHSTDLMRIALLSEEEFNSELKMAKFAFEENERKLKEIEEEKKAEAERLKIEAERQEKVAAEQRAIQEKLDAERKAIEAEKQALEDSKILIEQENKRKIEIEKARIEAAEKARIETEAKLKREAFEKMELERLAKEEAEAIEALRPDKEKLSSFALQLSEIKLPKVTTKEALVLVRQVESSLNSIIEFIEQSTKKLHKRKAA